MAIVVTLTGDVTDLEAKLKSAGLKIADVGDKTQGAGKQADGMKSSLDKVEQSLANMEAATLRTAAATEKLEGGTSRADSMADAFGNTERVLLGVNDNLGVLAEQFGVNLGPAQEYAQAAADVVGGLEGIIGGGMALVKQFVPMVTGQVPVIASTWAHVTALYAQAAAFVAANLPMLVIIGTIALVAAGVVLLVKNWDEIVEKIPFLGTAVDAIKGKLTDFTDWITKTFVPAVASLYDPAIKVPLELIVSYFQMQFDLVKIGVETVLGVIKGVVDVFMGVFTGDWQRAWDGVKTIVDSLWTGIKAAFDTGMKFLTEDLMPKILEAGKGLGGALKDGFIAGVKGAVGVIGTLADGLLTAITSLINTAIDAVNGAIPNDLNISVLGKSIGVDLPDNPIPHLASGMWDVPGPTGVDQFPALLAGGEMVLPAKPAAQFRQWFSAGGGGNNTIPFGAVSNDLDPTSKAQQELEDLLTLLRKLDQVSQDMWLADPKNAEFLANLRRAAAGLDPITPSIGDGPVFSPGSEGGPRLGGLPTPRVGGSGGVSAGGAPAAPGGGVKVGGDELTRLVELAEHADRRDTQFLDVFKAILDIERRPQTVELTIGGSTLDQFIGMLFDKFAQIERRQGGLRT